ncbi:hypothetical protein Tco_0531188 [Tanacetum coccineum]
MITQGLFQYSMVLILLGVSENLTRDDIVLIEESDEGLNNRLESWREALENNGLRAVYMGLVIHRSGRIDDDLTQRIRAVLADQKSSSEQGGSGGVENAEMREGRLRWFGNVKRRPQSVSVRRVEVLLVDGSRRRERVER